MLCMSLLLLSYVPDLNSNEEKRRKVGESHQEMSVEGHQTSPHRTMRISVKLLMMHVWWWRHETIWEQQEDRHPFCQSQRQSRFLSLLHNHSIYLFELRHCIRRQNGWARIWRKWDRQMKVRQRIAISLRCVKQEQVGREKGNSWQCSWLIIEHSSLSSALILERWW